MDPKEKIELLKIGFVTTIGLIAIVVSIFWLKGHKVHNYQQFTFYFKNVNGLEPGAAMRWNGLKIGVVEKVEPVLDDLDVEPFPAEELIKLGKKHLDLAQEALSTSNLADLAFARECINKGQIEIALGQASKARGKIKKGEFVKVEAYVTTKEVPIKYLNQVTISPTGLIGEQFLDIKSFDFEGTLASRSREKFAKGPHFVVLEPIKLDRLIRVSVESAEAVRDATNRFNALFGDEDAERIKELIQVANDIASDSQFQDNVKESVQNVREISDNLKGHKFKIWDFFF